MPFRQVKDYLDKLFNITLSKTTIQNAAEGSGKYFEEKEESEIQNKLSNIHFLHKNFENIPKRVYIEIDGWMINTTENRSKKDEFGSKEYKLALVFSEDDIK